MSLIKPSLMDANLIKMTNFKTLFKITIIIALLVSKCQANKDWDIFLESEKGEEHKTQWKKILKDLEKDNITLGKFLGEGSYGVVFAGEKVVGNYVVPMAFKFMRTDSELECQNLQIAQQMADAGAKYILKLYYIRAFKFIALLKDHSIERVHFCVLGFELGSFDFFEMELDESKPLEDNTQLFIETVYKILKGFKTLNFDAGYLHGDIKPENMIIVEDNGYYEPRIIDFDLSFKPTTDYQTNRRIPPWMVYTDGYRPPEIQRFCQVHNNQLQYPHYFSLYNFDQFFREDAFALGQTLKKILYNNKGLVLLDDPIIKFISDTIIRWMIEPNIIRRWSTLQAFREFKDLLQKYGFKIRSNPNEKKPEIPL